MLSPRTPSLGKELRALRETRGLSVRDLSARSGLSVPSLSKLEAGRRYPSLRTLEALAPALDIRIIIDPRETILEWA